MGYLHGPATLYTLVSCSLEARLLFEARAAKILGNVMQIGGMPCEVQMLLCAIIAIRQAKLQGPSCLDYKSLETYLDSYIPKADDDFDTEEDSGLDARKNDEPLFNGDLLATPMTFLKDCDYLCSQIALAEESFTDHQQPNMKKRSKTKGKEDGGQDLRNISKRSHRRRGLSRTERYRVCRALLRLWLYYEISAIVRKWIKFAGDGDWSIKNLLLDRITVWEVE